MNFNRPLTKPGSDCGSDRNPDRIGLAIRLIFKVTLIACWLLYDCGGLG